MKRISTLILALVVFLPAVAQGYYGYHVPLRYRTRYSPYAFSHKYRSGLIDGDLRYHPYAFGQHSSGLVPYWFRYHPYVFGHENPSGLISDYWHSSYYRCAPEYEHCGSAERAAPCSADTVNDEAAELLFYKMRQKYEENLNARMERVGQLKKHRQEANATSDIDGGEIIHQYLKSKNINFQMNRILRVDNKRLSVDFLLKNRNTLIRYCDPKGMERLARDSGCNARLCERYRQMCSDFSEEFEQKGGKIYQIVSASAQEILDKLALCNELNAG